MAQVASTVETVKPRTSLVPSLTIGVVLSFTEVIFVISLASLIFSGPLEPYLPRGIAIVLVTAIIHMLFTVLFTSSKGIIASIQDNPAVVLTVAMSSIAAVVTTEGELIATIIALILLSTLLTGVCLVLLGTFRLGGLVRYIPYPVIGGFLAGAGWLLVQGSIGTMSNYPLTLSNLGALFDPAQMLIWLPGVVLGVVLFVASQRFNHFLLMPGILIGWLIIFFVVFAMSGLSFADAQQRGLLFRITNEQAVWQPPLDFVDANWGAILGQVGNIGAVILITTVDLLLNISALEIMFHRDVELNRELRTAGVANLISGVFGGMIGYHSLGLSTLNHRMGAKARTTSILIGIAYVLMLLFGTSILAYTPRALAGGLLLSVGLDFMYTWVVQGRKKLGQLDYAVVLCILLTIATLGFLMGTAVGLILMIVLFVVHYSRLNIFRSVRSGAEVTSHVQRNAYHQRALGELGTQVYVLELQGFLFFGTANLVLESVRARLEKTDEKRLSLVLLDFRHVTGLDSSAVLSFTKVYDLAKEEGFTLVLTHLTQGQREKLTRNGLIIGESLVIFPDLDHGLEWCENTVLERDAITKLHLPVTLTLQLADLGFKKDETERLKTYLEQMQFKPGEYLMRQGEQSHDLYFIEIGQVSIKLELETGRALRIQTLGMGTIVGEVGLYLDAQRSASVIADENTIAYRLTQQSREEMKTKDPLLMIAFNELMVRVIAERLKAANREIAALHR
jgi:SulP family sulfate permease